MAKIIFDKNSFRSYTHGRIIGPELGSRKRVLEGRREFYEYRALASNQTSKQIAHKSSIHRHSKSFN